MSIKITTEEFIKRAREVHGDKYDYSKVEYVNNHTKVCIICTEHGDFWQRADSHLSGIGCPKCSKKYKYETEEFIKRAREVHGNKYDYTKTQYKGGRQKICINCPEHGEFWKLPYEHLNGKGCPKCVNKKFTNTKSTTEEFIERAKKVHNNKYDYSKVDYENGRTKVCITCPEHGEFWQLPYVHLQGHGCPKCKTQMFSNKYRLTLEEFIKKANKCHNNFYDYSKVKYINAKEKVCITCPEHGEFWQLPNNHLFGNGCPECKKSKLEKKMKNFLIENKIRFSEEKTFEWLIYKENMRLDFYLPDYNIAIECQGEQHFKPVNFGCETEEDMFEQFKIIQDRDKKKKELCNTNNIKLLYYSDKKYENNIFTDLKEILKYIEICSK